jgi:hypothetical protein
LATLVLLRWGGTGFGGWQHHGWLDESIFFVPKLHLMQRSTQVEEESLGAFYRVLFGVLQRLVL